MSRQDLNIVYAHALLPWRFRAGDGDRGTRAVFARMAVLERDLVRTRVNSCYEAVVKMLEDYRPECEVDHCPLTCP